MLESKVAPGRRGVLMTPDEISTRVFSGRVFGGYDKKEVHRYLERLSEEVAGLIGRQKALIREVREKESQLREFRDREELLREAMTTAQKTSARIQQEACESAKKTVMEAHHKADLIVQDARDSLKTVYQDLSDLRRVHVQLKNTLKAVLQSHQDLLEQDPVHTLLPQMSASEEEIEDKVSKTLSELSKTKDLL